MSNTYSLQVDVENKIKAVRSGYYSDITISTDGTSIAAIENVVNGNILIIIDAKT